MLTWLDKHKNDPSLAGQGFRDWKPFRHPQLGNVEVGGLTRFWLFNVPPGPYFRRVVQDQARFSVYRALLTPLVQMRDVPTRRDPADPGGWIVEATAANGATTPDPVEVAFPFMWGTRGGSLRSLYRKTWHVRAQPQTVLTVEIRSEKGGVGRQKITLN